MNIKIKNSNKSLNIFLTIFLVCLIILSSFALVACGDSDDDEIETPPTDILTSTPYELNDIIVEYNGSEYNSNKGELTIYIKVTNNNELNGIINANGFMLSMYANEELRQLYFTESGDKSKSFSGRYETISGQSGYIILKTNVYSYWSSSFGLCTTLTSEYTFMINYLGQNIAIFKPTIA